MNLPVISAPLTRAECREWPLPCRLTRCRYHLDAREKGTHRTARRTTETCALTVAESGPSEVNEVADHLGVTRQRVNQLEALALRKLARGARHLRRQVDE